jgi:hypothetical protein
MIRAIVWPWRSCSKELATSGRISRPDVRS